LNIKRVGLPYFYYIIEHERVGLGLIVLFNMKE